MWDFPENAAVNDKTRAIWEQGGLVGAVCHGPAALVNVTLSDGTYLVADRDVAAFTDAEEAAVGLTEVVPSCWHRPSPSVGRGYILPPTGRPGGHRRSSGDGQNPQSATGVGEALRDRLLSRD